MKLSRIIILAVIVVGGMAFKLQTFSQDDYVVLSERFEVVRYAHQYVDKLQATSFKFNRTHFAFNMSASFNTDFGDALEVKLQLYQFLSNEYRQFPLSLTMNLCEALSIRTFGIENLYNCGHFFKCPVKKGHYSLCNWAPDYTQFPPHLVRGRFMVDIVVKYVSIEVFDIHWFLEIKDKYIKY